MIRLKLSGSCAGAILENLVKKVSVASICADDFIANHDVNNDANHVVYPATARYVRSTSSTARRWFALANNADCSCFQGNGVGIVNLTSAQCSG